MFQLKRVYEDADKDDGARFLVDRLWPRGIKKEALTMDAWLKDAAPSTDLRRWFGHDPAKWEVFERRYRAELDDHPDAWKPLVDASRQDKVTLLYAARDTEHNEAVVLKAYLEAHLIA